MVILLVTPQAQEFAVFERQFRAMGRRMHVTEMPAGPYARLKKFEAASWTGSERSVLMVQPESIGRLPSALATQHILLTHHVSDVIVAGVAGSIAPEAAPLGSVILVDQVIDVSQTRLADLSITVRPSHFSCSMSWNNCFSAYASTKSIDARVGTTLSTDNVIASATLGLQLKREYPRALAVEMEGGGVAASVYLDATPRNFNSIRGIVDLANSNKRADAARYVETTLINMAEMLFHCISRNEA